MSLRFHRLFPLVLALAPGFAGCEGCGEEPPTPGGADSISFRFPNGNGVQADGSSRLTIRVEASKANGDPELAAITVTREDGAGQLALAGEAPNPDTVTGDPNEDGELELDVICSAAGQLRLEADNGKVKKTTTVNCNEVSGDIAIDVDTADCDTLQADGVSTCLVTVQARQLSATPIPVTSPIEVTVTSVDLISAEGDVDDAVLLLAENGVPSSAITIIPLADGSASFFVASPLVNLEERINLQLTTTQGSTTGTTQTSIVIGEFTNEAAVAFVETDNSIIGGDTLTATVEVRGTNGDLLESAPVSFSVTAPPGLATLPAVTTVTTDVNGRASIDITTATVTATDSFDLTATFFVLGDVQVSSTLNVTVNIEGALLLNASVSPTSIRSDDPTRDTATITVTATQDGGPVLGGTLSVSVGPGQSSRIQLLDANLAPVNSLTFPTNASQTFDAQVTVTAPGVAPGRATVIVEAVDQDGQTQSTEVSVDVLREPVLQSVVFVSADPQQIAVRGSSFPTTTRVEFTVFDDVGNPMKDVGATFTKSATADPGISVVDSAISDASGKLSTILSAGTVPGPVTVIITATDPRSGATLTVESAPIAITGGLPSASLSKFVCGEGVSEVFELPFNVACTAELVDRNTNTTPDGLAVQFSAEGGSMTPFAISAGGTATGTFATGDTFIGGSDVLAWSYGAILPDSTDLPNNATMAGCFDNSTSTPCDLVAVCEQDPTATNPAGQPFDGLYCPLVPECATVGTAMRDLAESPPDEVDAIVDPAARAQIADYKINHRACGFPVSCFTGSSIDYVNGDECPVNLGCLDFSPFTICPQDGLLTLTARSRGEETFNDDNGNGVFDFDDVNGNGRQDINEPLLTDAQGRPLDTFTDLSEPFVDRNDNCVRDELTESLRLSPSEQQAVTDLFFDVDGNGAYGFDVLGTLQEFNGVWDRDTEILLQEHVLGLLGRTLVVGTRCDAATTPIVNCAATPGFQGAPAVCVETGSGEGIAACDPIDDIPAGGAVSLAFWWTDAFGNCPVPGLTGAADASSEGPVVLAGAETVEFDAALCGYARTSGALRPWCEEYPVLGAPVFDLEVLADCGDTVEDAVAKVDFSLQGTKRSFAFNILCAP